MADIPAKPKSKCEFKPKEQQAKSINVIDDKQVFSLHDEDLSFCNLITHTIPLARDMPV